MINRDIPFILSQNGIWLPKEVPCKYLERQ